VKILVVVASQTGRTARMADAFAEGAREGGASVVVQAADVADPDDVLDVDALAIGSGVHMGGIESSLRAFFERLSPHWMKGSLTGKMGAAFVSAGLGGRGGAELALITIWAHFAEQGMLAVPMHNRVEGFSGAGSHWGPIAWTTPQGGEAGPTAEHLKACRAHGRWVAECTERWKRGV
jgi:NAD(P)H dehydrogenase (quinone)